MIEISRVLNLKLLLTSVAIGYIGGGVYKPV